MSLHDVILLLLGMGLGMAAAVGLLGTFAMVDRVTMRTPPSEIPHDAEPRPDFVPEVFPEPAIDRAPSAPDDIPVLTAPVAAISPTAEPKPGVTPDKPVSNAPAVEPSPEPVPAPTESAAAQREPDAVPPLTATKRQSVEDLIADAFRKTRTPSGSDGT
jgi:hypothetical protein